ncbi:MAG: PAS domain-containing protein, partial [Dehalococcoidia bacterium]
MTKKRDRSRKALLENVDAAVEGKSTERLLRESEKRYRELVENITETIYEVDESGRVTYVSPVATTAGDYGLHEIAGRSFAELIHPEDLPRALEAFEGWLRGDAEPLEFRLLTKSGEARWHHSLARPILKAGRSVGVRGVLTDITERKRAEEALRESEEKFRLLAENAVDVVYRYRLRPNPGYEYISPSVTAMTGYAPHEFYADPDLDMKLVHPDDQGLLRLIIDRDLPGTSTLRCVHRDGSIVWMELTYTPSLSHDGTLLAFEGISRDITERKRAEEALRESEERFRSAFEHSAVGMALVAPDGRLLRVNRICWETLGYSEQEMISTTWQAITHPDDRDATQENVRRVLAGESSFFQIEKRFIHKNGHVMWGLVTSSLLRDCDGKPSYFITQIQDITERKRAEEALR